MPKNLLLASGYALGGAMALAIILLPVSVWTFALIFISGGIYVATEETLEDSLYAELVEENHHGMASGVLATVNGVGDLISSIVVGALWSAAGSTKMESKPDPKVSCTLSPEQLQKRRKKLLPGLFKRADKLSDLPDGISLQFKQRPRLLAELVQIVEREQDCCSFLSFQISVEASGGPVRFDITGPTGTREMLKSL